MLKVGIIGYGWRIAGLLKEVLADNAEMRVVAIADPNPDDVKMRAEACEFKEDYKLYSDAEEMLENEDLDGVIIGTRCNLHTQFTELVSKYNLPIFLEKPVAINEAQLEVLKGIAAKMDDKIVVSFPLRLTPLVQKAKEIIDSGKLGTICQVQAVNNVDYGRVYFKEWHRDESLTGGLWLQKATHDFDYINYLLGDRKPVSICATSTKKIFTGDMPAGITCPECPKKDTCPESLYVINRNIPGKCQKEFIRCSFAVDTGNQDCGTAIIMYDDGVHATYSQNFVVRHSESGNRGARIIGFLATLEFNWRTKELKVYHNHKDIVETYNINSGGGHGGGDAQLIGNFVEVMKGTAKSRSPLSEGIASVNMCLKAKKSSAERKFFEI